MRDTSLSTKFGKDALWAAAFTLATLWIFLPGFISNDSILQLIQARGTLASDAHPPLMSILWRVTDTFIRGQSGMLLVQLYFYWFGIIALFTGLAGTVTGLLVAFAVGVFPPYFLLVGVIWKDIYMNVLLVLASVFIVYCSDAVKGWSAGRRFTHYILPVVVLSFLATMFRHNAIFAVIPFIFYATYVALEGKTERRVVTTGFVAAFGVFLMFFSTAAVNRSFVQTHVNVVQQVMAFDVAGIVYFSGPPDEFQGDITAVYEQTPPAEVAAKYLSCDVFPILVNGYSGKNIYTIQSDPVRLEAIEKAWTDLVLANPVAYVKHRLSVLGCSLGIGEPGAWYAPVFFYIGPEASAVEIAWSGPSVAQQKVISAGVWLSKTLVYKPWVYLLIALGVIAAAFVLRGRYISLAVVALSGIAYQAGYGLIGISTEFRYYTWLILAACISGAATLVLRFGADRRPAQEE